ncbi:hypothetical protein [Pannonibacter phragmitetus]|uniref:hypothetical protein n=1 Tax=Pannonibacter phragmitetus TaxID=121719 RepID=UPI0012DC0432|nr:hypothetical protein [Pannonibacter phragmitetus]
MTQVIRVFPNVPNRAVSLTSTGSTAPFVNGNTGHEILISISFPLAAAAFRRLSLAE